MLVIDAVVIINSFIRSLQQKGAEAPYFVLAPLIRKAVIEMPVMTKTPSAATDRIRLVKSTSTDRTSSASAMLTRPSQVLIQRQLQSLSDFLQHLLFFLIDAVVISDIQAQHRTSTASVVPATSASWRIASALAERGELRSENEYWNSSGRSRQQTGERGQSGDGFFQNADFFRVTGAVSICDRIGAPYGRFYSIAVFHLLNFNGCFTNFLFKNTKHVISFVFLYC
jgi:hypothetical protein